jgi:uncharacterized protein (DUF433 family)
MDATCLLEAVATELVLQFRETQATKAEPLPRAYESPAASGTHIRFGGTAAARIVTITEHPYIVRDSTISQGEPIIRGTGIRVRTLVEYWRLDISPQELLQYFPHLTLAQILDALSYYEDHQEEINALINLNRPHNISDQPHL